MSEIKRNAFPAERMVKIELGNLFYGSGQRREWQAKTGGHAGNPALLAQVYRPISCHIQERSKEVVEQYIPFSNRGLSIQAGKLITSPAISANIQEKHED